MIDSDILSGLAVPFIGTALGSACVFFMKKSLGAAVSGMLAGFAAGVMTAASVWSLIIPSVEQSEPLGQLSFLPAVIGFWTGMIFLLVIDRAIPRLRRGAEKAGSRLAGASMTALAVTIHNIPEGMAVGAVYAGLLSGSADITAGGAFTLAMGIAIQNIPEGAVISMPLHAAGHGKGKSFFYGALSGAAEPVAGGLTLLFAGLVVPAMPYLLSFAAGTMIYVVIRELVPELTDCGRPGAGVLMFTAGFTLMMALDVALG